MFVASAGLGLVDATRIVPTYGLTVAGTAGPDAVRGRVANEFDPASWWRALQRGPYATPISRCFAGNGLVVGALSHAYARLLGEELAALDDVQLKRLRLVGMGLGPHLPPRVRHASLLPYDDRLDRLVPGVRGDFCQRALGHFVDLIAVGRAAECAGADIEGHRTMVEEALGSIRARATARRSRETDEIIAQRIAARLRTGTRRPSTATLLRALREEDGIACEASRFSRLYRKVVRTKPTGTPR